MRRGLRFLYQLGELRGVEFFDKFGGGYAAMTDWSK
jgi:hypothetical protein